MHSIFNVGWDALEQTHVAEFLANADEEGLTWEAKADEPARGDRPVERVRPASIAKAACALTNQIGGYVLVGVRRPKGGAWEMPGIEPRGEEPRTWISQVLTDNLRPVPRLDSKAWVLDDGQWVIVVRVEPVNEAPCMTVQGYVFERVSSESRQITDPSRLDALFRRGQEAQQRAERFSERAADLALDAVDWEEDRSVGIAVALAPVGRETNDIGGRLFVPSFEKWALGLLADAHGPKPDWTGRLFSQDALSLFAHTFEPLQPDERFDTPWHEREPRVTRVMRASWDGAVAVSASFTSQGLMLLSTFDHVVEPAWSAVDELARLLGGYGPGRLTMMVRVGRYRAPGMIRVGEQPDPPPAESLYASVPEGDVVLKRDVTIGETGGDVIGSLQRELQRAAGKASYESE